MPGYAPTGDGLIAALQVLRVFIDRGKPASDLLRVFDPAPQLLENVQVKKGVKPLDAEPVKAAISAAGERLGKAGRLVVRASGTEPVIRVMAEGEKALIRGVVDDIRGAIEQAAGK